MPAVLDIAALRTLTAIADCGGYHRAAESLRMSQPTVSQHVRKLETTLGRTLLERNGRGMRFTDDGETLLVQARGMLRTHDEIVRTFAAAHTSTIVVGSTEHAAEHLLPYVRSALASARPESQIHFRLDRGRNLNVGLDRGTVDVAVLLGTTHPDGTPAGALPLTWYAAPGWTAPPEDEPLPLVVIDGPCTIRSKAIRTLTDAGRRHAVVAEAGYLSGVLNVVRAGVGVALVANPGPAPEGLEARHDLPSAAPEPLHVRVSSTAPDGLSAIVTSAVEVALRERPRPALIG